MPATPCCRLARRQETVSKKIISVFGVKGEFHVRLIKFISPTGTAGTEVICLPRPVVVWPAGKKLSLKRLYLYSALKVSFMFASLNSFRPPVLPGPRSYACHALLSFGPPAKKLLIKGMLFEFP